MEPKYQVGFLKDLMSPSVHPWFYSPKLFYTVEEARDFVKENRIPNRPYRIIQITVVEQVGVEAPASNFTAN